MFLARGSNWRLLRLAKISRNRALPLFPPRIAFLANCPGQNWSGDGHQEHVCSGERSDARFDCSTEPGDDDGEFAARDEGEASSEA